MNPSIGADVAQIARFEPLLQKDAFVHTCFTENERAYFARVAHSAQAAAATFAAKEAFAKAIRTGLRGFSLREVEVLREPSGAPVLKLHGRAEQVAHAAGYTQFSVSLSHDGGLAFAVVLATG